MKKLTRKASLLVDAAGSWSKTTRWSMRSLAELGREEPSSNAKTLLRDVSLRLGGQYEMCTKLMEQVSKILENGEKLSNSSEVVSSSNRKVIRALNQPVHISFQNVLKHQANLKLECDKAHRQLYNLRVLHEDTYYLTRDLLNNEKLLERFSTADRHIVAATMEQVRSRHATTVETLADICIGLEQVSGKNQGFLPVVETFLQGRLRVQLLCDHYVALDKGKPKGGVSVDCSLHDVVDDAVTEAKHMCDAHYNTAPEVLLPDLDHRITLIRPWVHHALVELLKNAMVSSVQRATKDDGQHSRPCEIQIRLRSESHYLCLYVIDQGVGLTGGDDAIQKAFGFAQSSALQRWDRLDEQQSYAMVRSPLQSLGVGLPLSRMMMRHFGGDVTLSNRPTSTERLNTGCTAALKLHTDDTFSEKIPFEMTAATDERADDAITSI